MPKELAPYEKDAVATGYPFACTCGECYRNAAAAWGCRKCRTYLMDKDFLDRKVWDLRTGEEVPREAW